MKDGFTSYESDGLLKIVLQEPRKWYMEFASKLFGFIVCLLFIGFLILAGYQMFEMILLQLFEIGMILKFLLSVSIIVFIWFAAKTQISDSLYTEMVLMTPQTLQYSRTVMFVAFMKRTITLKEIDAFKVLGETELSENIDENEVLVDPTDEEVEESEMSEEEILRILSEEKRLEEERVEKITISDAFKKETYDPKRDFKIEVANWRTPLYMGRSITSWEATAIIDKMELFRAKFCN